MERSVQGVQNDFLDGKLDSNEVVGESNLWKIIHEDRDGKVISPLSEKDTLLPELQEAAVYTIDAMDTRLRHNSQVSRMSPSFTKIDIGYLTEEEKSRLEKISYEFESKKSAMMVANYIDESSDIGHKVKMLADQYALFLSDLRNHGFINEQAERVAQDKDASRAILLLGSGFFSGVLAGFGLMLQYNLSKRKKVLAA